MIYRPGMKASFFALGVDKEKVLESAVRRGLRMLYVSATFA